MAGQVEVELLAAELESVTCTAASNVSDCSVVQLSIAGIWAIGLPLNTIARHECFVGHTQVCRVEIHGRLDGCYG
jgi:hypothetical protein